MDITNNRLIPEDHPTMVAVHKWWNTRTTYKEREIWHAVTCLNSRTPSHLRIAGELANKIAVIMHENPPT